MNQQNTTQDNTILGAISVIDNPLKKSQLNDNPLMKSQLNNTRIVTNNNDFFPELQDVEQVKVKQDTTCIDCICLCPRCTDNKYNVFSNTQGNTINKLYELKEEGSSFFERCCCYKCHSFTMKINNIIDENRNSVCVILEAYKPFACGLCCNIFGCDNPTMSLQVKTPEGANIGKALITWNNFCCSCCSSRIHILDDKDQLKYIIRGPCPYPPGCLCINCCTKFCDCQYPFWKGRPEVSIPGSIVKDGCDSFRLFCTKATNFTLNFPQEATPSEKMLIIIAAILLDSQSFPI